jgi:hypothetical protein
MLDRARVGDLVDAAADEQVPGQRSRGGVLHHLVHLQLLFRAPVSRKKLCVRSSTRSPEEKT